MIYEIKERMKKHDYTYEYSDDMRDWREGAADFQQIVKMIATLPAEQRDDLIASVPVLVRPRWVEYLNIVLTKEGKL